MSEATKKNYISQDQKVELGYYHIALSSTLPQKGRLAPEMVASGAFPKEFDSFDDPGMQRCAETVMELLSKSNVACLALIFNPREFDEYVYQWECSPALALIRAVESLLPNISWMLLNMKDESKGES